MTEISIRPATEVDAKLLTDLAYTTFWDAFAHHPKNEPNDLAHYMRQAFSLEQIINELSDPNSVFIIAAVDDEPAGYAKLIYESTEPEIIAEWPVELSRLYSHQRYLGQGVGQLLLDECIGKAKDAGRDVMWLGVWEYNPRAKRFYEKNGFRIVGSHTFQLGSDPQTDLLMQKRL
jgi:diamine N-acetyltransferase